MRDYYYSIYITLDHLFSSVIIQITRSGSVGIPESELGLGQVPRH